MSHLCSVHLTIAEIIAKRREWFLDTESSQPSPMWSAHDTAA